MWCNQNCRESSVPDSSAVSGRHPAIGGDTTCLLAEPWPSAQPMRSLNGLRVMSWMRAVADSPASVARTGRPVADDDARPARSPARSADHREQLLFGGGGAAWEGCRGRRDADAAADLPQVDQRTRRIPRRRGRNPRRAGPSILPHLGVRDRDRRGQRPQRQTPGDIAAAPPPASPGPRTARMTTPLHPELAVAAGDVFDQIGERLRDGVRNAR